ncbi:MAG: hypothetical protein ABSD98_04065 [Candidatus Korobacteraceae bacterium]|jgi:hypothetical protein
MILRTVIVILSSLLLGRGGLMGQSAPHPHPSGSSWKVSVTHDRMEDTTKTSFILPSTDRTAYLHFECTSNVLFGDNRRGIGRDLYISTGQFLDPDGYVLIRIDSQEPISTRGVRSTSYKAMFIEDDGHMRDWYKRVGSKFPDDQVDYTQFIPAIMKAKRLLIRLAIFESTDRTWEFHPSGISLGQLEKVCKISDPLPRDPLPATAPKTPEQ